MMDSEYVGRRMHKMKQPGRKQRGRPERRFMGLVREDMQIVEQKRLMGKGKMEEEDLLWQLSQEAR